MSERQFATPSQGNVGHSSETAAPARSRTKRTQYVSKACEYCHSRKTKCDGHSPCQLCMTKGVECVKNYEPKFRVMHSKKRGREPDGLCEENHRNKRTRDSDHRILERLAEIERRLDAISPAIAQCNGERQNTTRISSQMKQQTGYDQEKSPILGIDGDGPGYTGETSVDNALHRVQRSLDELGACPKDMDLPTGPESPLLANEDNSPHNTEWERVHRLLEKHGLSAINEQWGPLVDFYCDEIHPLYPFLHIPSLRRTIDLLRSKAPATTDGALGHADTDSYSQALICLALGRSAHSIRDDNRETLFTSGWSFYHAAVDCVKGLFDTFNEDAPDLPRLQTLTLAVIYLFRVDATQRARKVLSMAVVHAYHLGLHKSTIVESAPPFLAECSRRTWWCIYLLDKRLGLDVGQPFMIQDSHMDTHLPHPISDREMEALYYGLTSNAPRKEPLGSQLVIDADNHIPYLTAMVGYSKIMAKVWNSLYQARSSDLLSDVELSESLEGSLLVWQRTLPSNLVIDLARCGEIINEPISPSQMKKKLLIQIRILWLRILIRRPMHPTRNVVFSPEWIDDFGNEITCISLAGKMIDIIAQTCEPDRINMFPFLPYLFGAASTLLGLMIKTPLLRPKFDKKVIQATQMMNQFCGKMWVSGRTERYVAKYASMVEQVVGRNPLKPDNPKVNPTHGSQQAPQHRIPALTLGRPSANAPATHPSRSHQHAVMGSTTLPMSGAENSFALPTCVSNGPFPESGTAFRTSQWDDLLRGSLLRETFPEFDGGSQYQPDHLGSMEHIQERAYTPYMESQASLLDGFGELSAPFFDFLP